MRQVLISLILALIAAPAWAQTVQQLDWCSSPHASADQRIAGCTARIQSGQEAAAILAEDDNSRGLAYDGNGLRDQAIADYTQAIAVKPNYAEAYDNRGADYGRKGLYDQVIADYTKAIALEPDDARAYNNRGNAFAGKGRYDQAIADFTQAIALKTDYARAYCNRGAVYDGKGLHEKAIADYRAALAVEPEMTTAREALIRLGAKP